ncbi:deoxynucleoside kinase [Micavibrio aeruginosavorus]|uniref:deoxynucleoside kinase n=1 Tax=Micavibrio aeruginosavorus TaxID=349221 RepID=UPI003F4AC165
MAFRVEIAGSLATGKTTLCQTLERQFTRVVYEELSGNPYLDKVRHDPDKYALPCQQWFVDNKVNAIRQAINDNPDGRIISDFSLLLDRVYVSHYLAHRPDWVAALYQQLEEGVRDIGQPDVILYLTCPPDEIVNRIKKRGRDFEQHLTAEFARAINAGVQTEISNIPAHTGPRIIEIDTTMMRKPGFKMPDLFA